MNKKFSGVIVDFYDIKHHIYAVVKEIRHGTAIETDLCAVDEMRDTDIVDLIYCGDCGYASYEIPNDIKFALISKSNDTSIARSIITRDGLELTACDSKYDRLNRLFQKANNLFY